MELGLLFATRTISDYNEVLINGEESDALFLVYTSLIDEAKAGLYGIHGCDKFLELSMIEGDKMMSNDFIVHTLNVLSTFKEKLTNWDDFVFLSKKILTYRLGEEKMNELMEVIKD